MNPFVCNLCNYSTKLKCDYIKHTKTKKHRLRLEKTTENGNEYGLMNTNEHKLFPNEHKKNTKGNTNEHKPNIICEFCNKTFNSKASCRRHQKNYCKENPNFIDKLICQKNKKIKQLEQEKSEWQTEKKELYSKMDVLIEKVGDTNIQQNITLNNYGNEDLSHITDALKTQLLKIPYCAIPKMIEAVHFSDEKPENKNIILPNKNQPLVKIFQDNKWIYKNKNETIDELVDANYSIIDNHCDAVTETNISPGMITNFVKFKKYFEEGDKAMIDELKQKCELVLLNNRDKSI